MQWPQGRNQLQVLKQGGNYRTRQFNGMYGVICTCSMHVSLSFQGHVQSHDDW